MKIKFFFVCFLFLLTNNLVLAQDLEFESTTDNPLEQNILSEQKNENSDGCSVENQKLLSASLIQCNRKLTESKTECETKLTESKTVSEKQLTESKTASEKQLTESKIASEKQLKKKTKSLTACKKKLIDRKKKDKDLPYLLSQITNILIDRLNLEIGFATEEVNITLQNQNSNDVVAKFQNEKRLHFHFNVNLDPTFDNPTFDHDWGIDLLFDNFIVTEQKLHQKKDLNTFFSVNTINPQVSYFLSFGLEEIAPNVLTIGVGLGWDITNIGGIFFETETAKNNNPDCYNALLVGITNEVKEKCSLHRFIYTYNSHSSLFSLKLKYKDFIFIFKQLHSGKTVDFYTLEWQPYKDWKLIYRQTKVKIEEGDEVFKTGYTQDSWRFVYVLNF